MVTLEFPDVYSPGMKCLDLLYSFTLRANLSPAPLRICDDQSLARALSTLAAVQAVPQPLGVSGTSPCDTVFLEITFQITQNE